MVRGILATANPIYLGRFLNSVNSPDTDLTITSPRGDTEAPKFESIDSESELLSESSASMTEYYQLQKELWITTVIIAGLIFPTVWFFYSLNVALNYVIGAAIGVVYLRLLGKKVESIGRQQSGLGNARFALIVGIIVVASRLQHLEILPIFLGFLTYKAAIIVYMLRALISPES